MTQRHVYYDSGSNGEDIFTVSASSMKFGPGALGEVGGDAKGFGMKRVAFFVDAHVATTESGEAALASLKAAGLDVAVYDECAVEPTDKSFIAAADFARDGNFDGYVSLGGGSIMDTAKAANLFATHGGELMEYVHPPAGGGKPVPGPLKPHIACPTTCGTGSEMTTVAVFDMVDQHLKTGISSKFLKPDMALIDPVTTLTLPAGVVASTGFDVLTHAIESYTARPYTSREKPEGPAQRPPYQGANPYSDIGSLEAIWLGAQNLVPAVTDASNHEARFKLMYASALAGIAFGNAGVHIPHALSYSVAGMNHTYQATGYEGAEPMVPHGISVVLTAPATFRRTAFAAPERHIEVAAAMGADLSESDPSNAGEALAGALIVRMRAAGLPNGLGDIGYTEDDIPALVKGTIGQHRILAQSPLEVDETLLSEICADAMKYWQNAPYPQRDPMQRPPMPDNPMG